MEALEYGDMTNAAMFERNLAFLLTQVEVRGMRYERTQHARHRKPFTKQANENKNYSFLRSPWGPRIVFFLKDHATSKWKHPMQFFWLKLKTLHNFKLRLQGKSLKIERPMWQNNA